MSDPLFPNEFNAELLKVGDKVIHNSRGDWSAQLTYDDLPLHLQTPWLRNVFGESSYTNSNNKTSYSLSFELRDDEPSASQFKSFLQDLDTWMKENFKEKLIGGEYFSSIRPSKREDLPDTLRVKLKTRRGTFDCRYFEGRAATRWDINSNKIQHGDRCRMVLELLPIWSANKRVGISWKAVTIQKVGQPNLRTVDEDEHIEEEPSKNGSEFIPDTPSMTIRPLKRQQAIPEIMSPTTPPKVNKDFSD